MITDEHSGELKDIFVKHGVVLAYLFGSQAEGTARPSSDVDLAVLLPGEMTPIERFHIQLKLLDECGRVFQRDDVDVAILNEATALLAHQVVKFGKVLYEDEATRPAVDFAAHAISYYADTAHFRKLAWKYLMEDIERYRQERSAKVSARKAT